MRSNNNKLFVKTMIITATIGLTVLMATMFVGIKFFTEKNVLPHEDKVSLPVESPQVEISSTILGSVKKISEEKIELFDIEKKQVISTKINKVTKVEDAYSQAIPITEINQGDIVEVIYEPQKDLLISISKTNRGWEKKDVNKIKVSLEKDIISIGKHEYTYGKDTLILNEKGQEITPEVLGEYDKLRLTGVDSRIWSIKVIEKQGQVILGKLPTLKGTLEIDTNRIIRLEEIKDPIGISPGSHKIVLNMEGYQPITKNIEVTPGSDIKITGDGAEIAYTNLSVTVSGTADYDVEVNGKIYKPREIIKLEQGVYTVKITADGFKPWAMQLDVEGDTKSIHAVLTSNTPTTQEPVPSEEPKGDPASYQINISTDPAGAEVYIGGIYKGTTPYKTTLPVGDYSVELKKQGYEAYTTSLIIDNSDNQNSYQYVLTPIQ